jgi:hypothetical protein
MTCATDAELVYRPRPLGPRKARRHSTASTVADVCHENEGVANGTSDQAPEARTDRWRHEP